MDRVLEVLDSGPQLLVQDLGRAGYAHLGVPPSGALDVPSLRLGNRLVGNPEGAAGLESLLGAVRLRAGCSCTVAVTGPSVPVRVNDAWADSHVPLHLAAGDVLRIGTPRTGLRVYLAVSGGVAVPEELGSRSTDLLSGLGPAPLRAGDVLPLGRRCGVPVGVDTVAPVAVPERIEVPVLLGPRDDWFDDAATALRSGRWTVSPDSNRVGLRLTGPALRRAAAFADRELPSEGLVTGAVQVPADGRPVVFLADHPTTGGYPVVAVAAQEVLPLLAQARPGTEIRFRPTG
ncbi:MAG TPA: biotin-dependent carboxyltransferase family protein [Pseudonocardiaceae bacterium]